MHSVDLPGASGDAKSKPPTTGLSRLLATPASRRCLLLTVALVAALILPRAVALDGLTDASNLDFIDQVEHMMNQDLLLKWRTLGPAQFGDKSVRDAVEQLQRTVLRPGGIYAVANVWAAYFGSMSLWTVQGTNLVFTLIMLGGVIWLGRRLTGRLELGLWAALVAALSPALTAAGYYYNLDYPLAAMITVGLALLWSTENFSNTRNSLALGLWSGLGLFVKFSYGLFMVLPSLWLLGWGLWRGSSPRLKVGLNVAVAVAAALGVTALAMPGLQVGDIYSQLTWHASNGPLGLEFPQAFTLNWFTAYPLLMMMNYPWPLLAPALFGFVLLHERPWRRSSNTFLLVFVYGAYAVFTLLNNKWERYLLPLYPLAVVLSVWAVASVTPRRLRTLALTALAGCYAALLTLSYLGWTPWSWPLTRLDQPPEVSHAIHPPMLMNYIDLIFPTRAEFDKLKRYPENVECDLKPLRRQLKLIGKRAPMDRPLAVGVTDSGKNLFHEKMYAIFPMMTIQEFPNRVVLRNDYENFGHVERALPNALNRDITKSTLLVLHHPDRDVLSSFAKVKQLGRRKLKITCKDGSRTLQLTLYQIVVLE